MQEPTETVIVTFFETPCLAARLQDGTIVIALRDLCAAVGLRLAAQLRRLRADPDLRDGLVTLRVLSGRIFREQEFLILEFIPAWIASVDRTRASVVVQERLRYLRLFSIREVYAAVARTAGLPEGPSNRIEDLRDLEHFDDAMGQLAAQQRQIEESQDKARQAWKDHEQRLRRVEERLNLPTTLSEQQRGTIYHMVQVWAEARVTQEGITTAKAFAGCWGAIKTKYNVAKYEHLPATTYAECVRFIAQAYEKLTGQPLVLIDPEAGP